MNAERTDALASTTVTTVNTHTAKKKKEKRRGSEEGGGGREGIGVWREVGERGGREAKGGGGGGAGGGGRKREINLRCFTPSQPVISGR